MLSEDDLREMELWAEDHHGFDPVDSVKLVAEVRRLRAANAELLAACEAWIHANDAWSNGTRAEAASLTWLAVEACQEIRK
jgi:hypothetical protein